MRPIDVHKLPNVFRHAAGKGELEREKETNGQTGPFLPLGRLDVTLPRPVQSSPVQSGLAAPCY